MSENVTMNQFLFENDPVLEKRCRKCEEWKPLSDFGVNFANIDRGARDGKNILCKRCIRERIREFRERHRVYKEAHNSSPPPANRRRDLERRLCAVDDPVARVREAIRTGARTLKQIVALTRLKNDDVTDAIADLLLWTREIRTHVVNGQRMYFVNNGRVVRRPVRPAREPRSYGVSSIYEAA